MVAVRAKRWTRAQYDRLAQAGFFSSGERVELIEGEIIELSPQDPRHSTSIVLGQEVLQTAFGPDYYVRVQLPLALEDDSEPEPDQAVILGSRRAFASSHPTGAALVVEVAESSLQIDRERKSKLYARGIIPECWIINLVDRLLEVYRDPRPDLGYATRLLFGPSDEGAPLVQPSARISVGDLL